MGGGGGGWFTKQPINLQTHEGNTKRLKYESDVNDRLGQLLKGYNDRDVKAIGKYLEKIHAAISQNGNEAIDLLLGGSISKHTYVDGLSDVDVLARIKDVGHDEATPAEFLAKFSKEIGKKIPEASIKVGALAVSVKFPDGHEIQILPAVETKAGIKIPGSSTDKWSGVIRPQDFAAKLTETNSKLGGKLVPVIKLFKALVSNNLAPQQKLSGYHAESLAIEAFKDYSGGLNYKDMLGHLCNKSSTLVLSPIKDKTGQSVHVDNYLGDSQSAERKSLSTTLKGITNKLKAADDSCSPENFEGLF